MVPNSWPLCPTPSQPGVNRWQAPLHPQPCSLWAALPYFYQHTMCCAPSRLAVGIPFLLPLGQAHLPITTSSRDPESHQGTEECCFRIRSIAQARPYLRKSVSLVGVIRKLLNWNILVSLWINLSCPLQRALASLCKCPDFHPHDFTTAHYESPCAFFIFP